MSNVNKDQPSDPDELANQQKEDKEKSTKTLDEVSGDDPDEILSPGDSIEWDHEAFPETTFTFIVPSARDYREAIPSEKIGASQGGDIQFDPTVIDDLMMQYVKPQPDMDNMAPGQFKALETAFYNFVQSFRRSDAEAGGQG